MNLENSQKDLLKVANTTNNVDKYSQELIDIKGDFYEFKSEIGNLSVQTNKNKLDLMDLKQKQIENINIRIGSSKDIETRIQIIQNKVSDLIVSKDQIKNELVLAYNRVNEVENQQKEGENKNDPENHKNKENQLKSMNTDQNPE